MNEETLIEKFSESLVKGNGIFFIGSGISAPSGFPTWKSLLEPLVKDLNIEISDSDDLTEIAQFIVNEYTGNKGPLLSDLLSVFNSKKEINSYHEILVRTNIKKIWTTNFDMLLENAFRTYNIETEIKSNDSDFIRNNKKENIQIVKMHGCVNRNPKDIIFIQEDYEDFFSNKPAIANQLQSDLLSNSFLFIGYNFGDINLKNILIETRRLSNRITRPHFLIQKRESDKSRRQELWCNNLKRFGIETLIIEDYSELNKILNKIANKSKGKTIFVTGSHLKDSDEFVSKLGTELAKIDNITLLDGQSTGIGRICINNYSQSCLERNIDINNRIQLFPNPYAINKDFSNKIELLPVLKKWRNPIFQKSQIVIVFDGGIGTKAEIELAGQFNGFILPIPLKKDGLAFEILIDNKDKLDEIDSDYYTKAFEMKLTVQDVIKFINKILEQ